MLDRTIPRGSGASAPGPRGRPRTGLRRWWAPGVQLVAVCVVLLVGSAALDSQRAAVAADVAADRGVGQPVHLPAVRPRVAAPVAVEVARLGIRSSLLDLHLRPDGTLQTPADFARAGWWADGPRPGDAGPAVVVGHVDSQRGPGVFYRLRELRSGDQITIRRADNTTARFVVSKVQTYEKRAFPTAEVYGGTAAGLRLITCGGAFDRRTGHYLSNTVVFAVPLPAPKAAPHAVSPLAPAAKPPAPAAKPAAPARPAPKVTPARPPRRTPHRPPATVQPRRSAASSTSPAPQPVAPSPAPSAPSGSPTPAPTGSSRP